MRKSYFIVGVLNNFVSFFSVQDEQLKEDDEPNHGQMSSDDDRPGHSIKVNN